MKRIFFFILLISLLSPLIAFGASYNSYEAGEQTVIYQGLVPCGNEVCVYNNIEPGTAKGYLQDFKDFEIDDPNFTFQRNCETLNGTWRTATDNKCEFCHLFIITNGIIKFIMFRLVPVIAVALLIAGGLILLFAGANPNLLKQAKGIITSVIVGLVIILLAWVIVNTVLKQTGIVSAPSVLQWHQISCPIQ